MHEAGHLLATPIYALGNYNLTSFSAIIYIFAGSAMQWIVPLLFVLYFALKRQPFSAFAMLFWLSQNLCDIVPYIGDSTRMVMPLLSQNATYHPRLELSLLTILSYLPQTHATARALLVIAITILSISLIGAWLIIIY